MAAGPPLSVPSRFSPAVTDPGIFFVNHRYTHTPAGACAPNRSRRLCRDRWYAFIWSVPVNPPTARIPWSHDDLVIACGLYFTLPFGQMHSRNPKIVGVARALGRTPSSLAMKLVNFASLDPAHKARGVRGLAGRSRGDEQVWNEFHDNWDQMTVLSETRLQSLEAAHAPNVPGVSEAAPGYVPRDIPTETAAMVKVRTMQSFFRKAVLAAYDCRCCITGNPVEDLLVASHILPWSDFPYRRREALVSDRRPRWWHRGHETLAAA
jgi:hypothetical protein